MQNSKVAHYRLEPFAVKRLVGLPGDKFGSQDVRPGHCFLMGDNRALSLDSRAWGDIELDRLVGRVWFRYWPPLRAPYRSD